MQTVPFWPSAVIQVAIFLSDGSSIIWMATRFLIVITVFPFVFHVFGIMFRSNISQLF